MLLPPCHIYAAIDFAILFIADAIFRCCHYAIVATLLLRFFRYDTPRLLMLTHAAATAAIRCLRYEALSACHTAPCRLPCYYILMPLL